MQFLPTTIMLFLLGSVCAQLSSNPNNCLQENFVKGVPGFIANFFQYNLRSTDGWRDDFFGSSRYADLPILFSVPSIVTSNFRFKAENEKVVWGKIYGSHISISNYTIELTGYFMPVTSGFYKFTLKADNGASLRILEMKKNCKMNKDMTTVSHEVRVIDNYNGGGKIDSIKKSKKFKLSENLVYFVKLVTFNWQGNGGLDVSFTAPNSESVADFGNVIFQQGTNDTKMEASVDSMLTDFKTVSLEKPNTTDFESVSQAYSNETSTSPSSELGIVQKFGYEMVTTILELQNVDNTSAKSTSCSENYNFSTIGKDEGYFYRPFSNIPHEKTTQTVSSKAIALPKMRGKDKFVMDNPQKTSSVFPLTSLTLQMLLPAQESVSDYAVMTFPKSGEVPSEPMMEFMFLKPTHLASRQGNTSHDALPTTHTFVGSSKDSSFETTLKISTFDSGSYPRKLSSVGRIKVALASTFTFFLVLFSHIYY